MTRCPHILLLGKIQRVFAKVEPALGPLAPLGLPIDPPAKDRGPLRDVPLGERDSERSLLEHETIDPSILVPRRQDVDDALILSNGAF